MCAVLFEFSTTNSNDLVKKNEKIVTLTNINGHRWIHKTIDILKEDNLGKVKALSKYSFSFSDLRYLTFFAFLQHYNVQADIYMYVQLALFVERRFEF